MSQTESSTVVIGEGRLEMKKLILLAVFSFSGLSFANESNSAHCDSSKNLKAEKNANKGEVKLERKQPLPGDKRAF